ncbi:hypothetical protein DV736_g490, partial [Chaetothyriales sp. CBS 134916]
MGAGQSVPSGADSTKHVFSSATPINYSAELLDSLESSAETNSTRAKTLDLHIAQRVHEELDKIQKNETAKLEAARQKILDATEAAASVGSALDEQAREAADTVPSLRELSSISPKDLIASVGLGQSEGEKQRKAASTQKVQAEIERLKKELGQRKVLKELPKEVERARDGVVACLRLNDRRPLDCWKEVELFKREVKKLEDEFVNKVL